MSGPSSSRANSTSNQTTTTVTDSYNTSSAFTQNYSNVGNTTNTTNSHYGPESTSTGSVSSPWMIGGVLALVAMVILIRRGM